MGMMKNVRALCCESLPVTKGMGEFMNLQRTILLSAIVIAIAIMLSPTVLQGYKMFQCVSAMEKTGMGSQESNKLTCIQYIN